MFTSMFFYLFICLLLFGIGDVLGVATKAKVSAVFVSLMLFLVGFMTGVLPPDIIKLAGLTDIGKWSLIFVVFSMGTSLNIKQLIAEWRTVAVAVLSMIVLIAGSVVLADGELLVKVAGKQSGVQHLQALGVCLAQNGTTTVSQLALFHIGKDLCVDLQPGTHL